MAAKKTYGYAHPPVDRGTKRAPSPAEPPAAAPATATMPPPAPAARSKSPPTASAKPLLPLQSLSMSLPSHSPGSRSSLLEQLAQCQANSNALISGMQSTFSSRRPTEGLLLTLRTKYLHVGRCGDRFHGTARFFATELHYAFDHPRHRRVEMQMKYVDMLEARKVTAGETGGPAFSFRIGRKLEYFDREYDPANPDHRLLLRFNTEADLKRFADKVFPTIRVVAGRS